MAATSIHHGANEWRANLLAKIFWGLFFGLIAAASLPVYATDKFSWKQDSMFQALEQEFVRSQQTSAELSNKELEELTASGNKLLATISSARNDVPIEQLKRLEALQFRIAALAAAHLLFIDRARHFIHQARITVLHAASNWPQSEAETHELIYRIVYGGRAAIEEALAQSADQPEESPFLLESIKSAAPYTTIKGVEIHSGDILLSRGGAPTSALIARGSPFPGQFSHAALVYIDPKTKDPLVIEALIEDGVVITTAEEYLNRISLRIAVLRLRPDNPVLKNNPLAAHNAASHILKEARTKKIPYDFEMNWHDDSKLFCSEAVYDAYRSIGVDLWPNKTTITTPGLTLWLRQLGVRYFTMISPSDLEYDPNLAPVAEWVKIDTLKKDRYDSAILDVLLEAAEQGYQLTYPWHERPIATVVKGWSSVEGVFGAEPTIPKGMNTATALRVHSLTDKIHPILKQAVTDKANEFHQSHGYDPPYWILLKIAKEAFDEHKSELSQELRQQR